jgi:predicted outer membrane repeat protein
MGAFIFVILDVKLKVTNTAFLNGLASYGGAMYLSGQSEMLISGCTFSSNYANVYGGAIYGNGFKSIKLVAKTKLLNNIALSQGDDFFLSNTEEAFELDEVTISNPKARNSIHAEYVQVKLNNVRITDIKYNEKSEMGAAIQCIFCRRMIIDNSYFGNLKS